MKSCSKKTKPLRHHHCINVWKSKKYEISYRTGFISTRHKFIWSLSTLKTFDYISLKKFNDPKENSNCPSIMKTIRKFQHFNYFVINPNSSNLSSRFENLKGKSQFAIAIRIHKRRKVRIKLSQKLQPISWVLKICHWITVILVT